MKKYIAILLICAGCASTPEKKLDDLSFWTYLSAYSGTQYTLMTHPEYRPAFEAVEKELKVLVETQKFDAITLHKLLSKLPVGELRESPEAALAITMTSIIYSRYGKSIELNNNETIGVSIVGIHNGIQAALEATK